MSDSSYYQNKVQVISSILLGRGKQERDTSSLAVSENMKISLGQVYFFNSWRSYTKNKQHHSFQAYICVRGRGMLIFLTFDKYTAGLSE